MEKKKIPARLSLHAKANRIIAMNSNYLKTDRVMLRQYEDSDWESFLDLSSDPEVMIYLTSGVPMTREDNEAGIQRTLLYQKKYNERLGVFVAELTSTGEFIGWFHLRPAKSDLENEKNLELGYRLKLKFWRTGLATEVSQALIKKAFDELGAESVFAQTLATNLASRRVMEKVGMKFEKEFIDHEHVRLGPAVMYKIDQGTSN